MTTSGATPRSERSADIAPARDEDLGAVVAQLRRTDEDRTRLLEALTVALEAERATLAMDLHDGPIQHMATVALQLDLAVMALDAGDVAGARHDITAAAEAVVREVNGLRRVMGALRPPALEIRGLVEAVSDHVSSFAIRSGISCSTDLRLGFRLAPSKETVLYAVTQECLRNVHKHSGARNVHVELADDREGGVGLRIRDDGRGFDPAASALAGGGRLGLASLRERLELLGGTIDVSSVPNRGTTVTATLPTAGGER